LFPAEYSHPESLSIYLSDRHYGIGGDWIVLICPTDRADAKIQMFNLDGSEGKMSGNVLTCIGKYIYENKIKVKDQISIETSSGIKKLKLYIQNDKVDSVCVDMGPAELNPKKIPVKLPGQEIVNQPVIMDGKGYHITFVSMGNPHCVIFSDSLESINIDLIGPAFEYSPLFPERVNVEFVTVIDQNTLKMRVWERGNPGGRTGACAGV